LPLQRLAEWCYVEQCLQGGCSALLCRCDGHVWVARNNDFWAPELWGYVTIREVQSRVPTIVFGLEGELFAGTGINRERLWLHYNWLPVEDTPTPGKLHCPPFVWLTEALETCCDLQDVEALLRDVDRDGGMLLFAVDGRRDAGALFECTCVSHTRREFIGPWIAGTNHPITQRVADMPNAAHPPSPSQRRLAHLETLAQGLFARDDALTAVGLGASPGRQWYRKTGQGLWHRLCQRRLPRTASALVYLGRLPGCQYRRVARPGVAMESALMLRSPHNLIALLPPGLSFDTG